MLHISHPNHFWRLLETILPFLQTLTLVIYRIYSDLRREVSRSFLGIIWWILEPALYLAAFYFVFGMGMKQRGGNYGAFLMCGLVSWKWFAAATNTSASSVSAHHGLISQVPCQKWVFPTVVMGANFIKFVFLLIFLLFILPVMGYDPSSRWLLLLPVILTQLLWIAGCSLLLAAITPLIPDIKMLLNHATIALMFISGLTFEVETLSERIQFWLQFNPMVLIMDQFRVVLLENSALDINSLCTVSIASLLMMALGLITLHRLNGYYSKLSI